MRKYKCTVEYDGTNFFGMQKQDGFRTVQGCLEMAISKLNNVETEISYSGRTDRGVHAISQVISFFGKENFEPHNVVNGVNFYLQKSNCRDLVLTSCEIVDDKFDARFSAKQRRYVYKIKLQKHPSAIQKNFFWHVSHDVNVKNMIDASKYLFGSHDFSSFRSSGCYAKSPIKTVDDIHFEINNNEVLIYFSAKSFLYNMVRNMTGTLVDLFGIKKLPAKDMISLINACDRTKGGVTAPPHGLYFLGTNYT